MAVTAEVVAAALAAAEAAVASTVVAAFLVEVGRSTAAEATMAARAGASDQVQCPEVADRPKEWARNQEWALNPQPAIRAQDELRPHCLGLTPRLDGMVSIDLAALPVRPQPTKRRLPTASGTPSEAPALQHQCSQQTTTVPAIYL